MKISVVVFPGSNCDHDVLHAYSALGQNVQSIWHRESDLKNADIVVIPGGFSHGDYLRTGALAKLSPIMPAINAFAKAGGPVIGICNGFQILCESGLLPGVLLQNYRLKFLSQFVHFKVESQSTPWTKSLKRGQLIHAPIAHGEGNYFTDPETLKRLEGEGQIVFRYCNAAGTVNHSSAECNPNGSMNSIAGIRNANGNVLGLMPHPERAFEKIVGWIGADSGRGMFESSLAAA